MSVIPKPFRKPLWRRMPTETPGARSIVTTLASVPSFSNFAFAHAPISSPAFSLSVANSASAASSGSGGVSSAMTVTPAARAFSIAGTIALDCAGVIRMPFAPLVTMFSIAVIWVWTSVSVLPAALVSSALFAPAASCAASFIFTKNGFDSVLVIRPTWTFSPLSPPEDPLVPPLSLSSPQASDTEARVPIAATAAKRDVLLRTSLLLTGRAGCSLKPCRRVALQSYKPL